ncbi:polypeptide N-acetylgalactosaminyltransferase 14 isoform X1 [Penaeus vannamei]|uniref:polypeptide N-acetylgalactosaminyltransferase 14 isoform X1 n=1 Tax=Penaeus vannamei TaxID=6689 RepID=UPI00387F4FC7
MIILIKSSQFIQRKGILSNFLITLSVRAGTSLRAQAASDNASRHAPGAPPISVVEAVGYLAGGFVRDKEHDPFARHAFNARASNALPNDRRLPDTRDARCGQVAYDVDSLQTVSVVITFHNEARSALLRTVISVLTRTPDELLEDLILVDDASDDPQDGQLLAGLPKVRVLRNDQRQGLIRSRVRGADASQGETIFFLDSHCEVNQGWAVPLLEVLRQNPKTLACPVIDVIDQDTLDYRATGTVLKGGFDWGLHFRWVPLTQEEKDSRGDPTSTYRTPVIAGGLFLIARDWWEQLGKYDPGLDVWGAENLEMSFKAWQCGGGVEVVPCSRVGHIFRKRHPYSFPEGNANTYLRNSRRIAEVWLDEFTHFFYETRPNAINKPFGDVSERKEIRARLKCRGFGWFLKTTYPELSTPSKHELAYGQLRQGDLCLQGPEADPKQRQRKSSPQQEVLVEVVMCVGGKQGQEWSLTQDGAVTQSGAVTPGGVAAEGAGCLAVLAHDDARVFVQECQAGPKQRWLRQGRRLQHAASGMCLDSASNEGALVLPCRDSLLSQQWDFSVELQALTTL